MLDNPLLLLTCCSLLTTLICAGLIYAYRWDYEFSPLSRLLLISLSFFGSFVFGYFQETSRLIPTCLETLLIGPLLFLCATDLKALELPDRVNLLIGWLGLVHLCVAPFPPLSGILTAILLFIAFFIIALVSHGGLGGGDIKYVLAFGLWIPTHLILPFLLFSTLSASIYGILALIISREKNCLPFGPFLILSSIYLLFIF